MGHSKKHKRFLKVKELFILALVVSSLILLATEQFGNLTPEQIELFDIYDVIIGFILIGELLFELFTAPNKMQYLRHNWYFLLAAIPLPSTLTELLRSLRLIRVVRLVRYGFHMEHEGYFKK